MCINSANNAARELVYNSYNSYCMSAALSIFFLTECVFQESHSGETLVLFSAYNYDV